MRFAEGLGISGSIDAQGQVDVMGGDELEDLFAEYCQIRWNRKVYLFTRRLSLPLGIANDPTHKRPGKQRFTTPETQVKPPLAARVFDKKIHGTLGCLPVDFPAGSAGGKTVTAAQIALIGYEQRKGAQRVSHCL
jgi:hypothetical protein